MSRHCVLGVILAVYALYLLKDLLYLQEGVADNPFIYKLLLSIDTWAVPLYVMFAFEFLYPGKMTLRKDLLLFGSFPLFTLLYVLYPYDWVYSLMTVYAVVFSGVCICIVLRKTLLYRRMLKGSLSDITHMDVKWLWVSIALLLPNLVLWTFVSSRTDNLLDAVYYLSLSVTWGIIAYKIYYYKYPSASDLMSGDAHAEAVHATGRHFRPTSTAVSALHSTIMSTAAVWSTLKSCFRIRMRSIQWSSWPNCPASILFPPSAVLSARNTVCLLSSTARGCWKGVD